MLPPAIALLALVVASAAQAQPLEIVGRDPAGHGLLCRGQGKTVLFVEGTPEQMGAAHGSLLKDQAQKLCQTVLYVVGAADSLYDGRWFFDQMAEIERRTAAHLPSRYREECDALAVAAGVSQRDARFANLFPERFHCSGVALRGKATVDGRVIHARVLDYMRDVDLQQCAVVTVFMPKGRHRWISHGYAGFIGSVTAMNEKGLAIGEMGGGGEGQWDGMPMAFLMRKIMERASTVDEAVEIFRRTPRTCEYYYVVSDKSRAMVALHCTPEEIVVLEPGQQHPELPHVPEDTVLVSGRDRAEVLSQRIQQQYGKIGVRELIEIIKRPVAMSSNLHNAVFAPESGEIYVADAGKDTVACDEPYARFSLPELLAFYEAEQPQEKQDAAPAAITSPQQAEARMASHAPAAKENAPTNEATATRPNIIFLLTDEHRFDMLGAMGHKILQTPNLDRLASEGVLFNNCFVTTSICMTSRASILSGQYAARHGIWDFQTQFTPAQLADTYPGQLKQAGYWQGFIGKWGVGDPPTGLFDYDRGFPGQGTYEPKKGENRPHLTIQMGDQALEFLDAVPQDRPFCLSVSFKAPHVQDGDKRQFIYEPDLKDLYADVTIPPPPLDDPAFFEALPAFFKTSENRARWELRFTPAKYQEMVKGYYRLISGVDRVVGRVRERLRERGLDQNTIIIFSGDNGFYLGERGLAGKWYGHEASIRVPLMVFDPSLPAARRGARADEVVLNIDIAPTILDYAGIQTPSRMQGKSLVPLVEGKRVPWRTEFFYEHLFDHPKIPKSEGVRTPEWKYLRYVGTEPLYEELYDLTRDPQEAHNLAADPAYAATLDELRGKWAEWRKKAK
ncbi:MAG: C45 family autoproteolytic acyltransferase/hydrolase [Planctomycetota bacterium]